MSQSYDNVNKINNSDKCDTRDSYVFNFWSRNSIPIIIIIIHNNLS
jgi:hypothetical protein